MDDQEKQNNDFFNVTGTAEPDSSVDITFTDSNGGSVTVNDVSVDGNGDWSVNGEDLSSLEDGDVTVNTLSAMY